MYAAIDLVRLCTRNLVTVSGFHFGMLFNCIHSATNAALYIYYSLHHACENANEFAEWTDRFGGLALIAEQICENILQSVSKKPD